MEIEKDTTRRDTTVNPKGQAAMLKKTVKNTYIIVGIGVVIAGTDDSTYYGEV